MTISGRVSAVLVVASSLVACASLVGLDESDPALDSATPGGGSSGTGEITQDGITIKPKELTFEPITCGKTGAGTITLVNDSDEDQSYEASVTASDVFTVKGGGKGTIKARDTATITVEANGAKPGSPVAEVAIKTKSSVGTVSVKTEVRGAILKISPVDAKFGFMKAGGTATTLMALFANDGNVPITVTGFDGPAEKSNFSFPPPVVIPPGGSISQPLKMNGGEAGEPISAVVTALVDDESLLCGAPRPTLTLSGQRVAANVVANPASADFGTVDCNGTTATKQIITVSNFDFDNAATFSTELAPGSRFKVTPASGSLNPGQPGLPTKVDLTIEVVNAGSDVGPQPETLKIVTGPEPKTYDVALTIGVTGALLAFDPTTLTDIPKDGSKTGSVVNVGNSEICIALSSNKSEFRAGTLSLAPLSPQFPLPVSVEFKSATSGTFEGEISVRRASTCFGKSAVLCKTPAPLKVSGTAP